AALASLTMLIQYSAHAYSITSTRPFGPVLPILWNTFVNATVAEILIIGIVFRILEDWIGSYLSLAVLVVIFFILHVIASGATPLSALGVAMHAALLLAPVYIYTRSLWAPIAIHFAWDFSFAAIFGTSVNGYTMDQSIIQSQSVGSNLLTGGYFGPQGSIEAALLSLISGIIFLQLSSRRGNIKAPSGRDWR
ncbi:MAG TPA: CPBP family intramembrane glutamic endopeptidase, partial [Puia sp.]|nr:CPBP family intramembrane glutamic endopeptidase [Puia sp.]